MTQQQLAEACGTTKAYVSNLERGAKRYNEDLLSRFADALKCEAWELIGRNPLEEPDETAEIVDIWSHIDSGQKAQAKNILRTFVSKP